LPSALRSILDGSAGVARPPRRDRSTSPATSRPSFFCCWTRMRTSFFWASSYRWMPISPRPAPSRILRRWSTSGRSANRTAIAVPPEKSMPYFRPFWTKIVIRPSAITPHDRPMAHHLYFRKSMLVWRKNSIAALYLYGDRVDVLSAPVLELEDGVRDEHGREDGDEEADDQGDREALHGSCAELEQEHRRDDRGDVRVDDRRERLREAVFDRGLRRAAVAQLLADALEHEHVRVDGHTDRQDEARDARQRQRRLEERHRGREQHRVQHERDDGVPAGAAVVDGHRHEDEQRARHRR